MEKHPWIHTFWNRSINYTFDLEEASFICWLYKCKKAISSFIINSLQHNSLPWGLILVFEDILAKYWLNFIGWLTNLIGHVHFLLDNPEVNWDVFKKIINILFTFTLTSHERNVCAFGYLEYDTLAINCTLLILQNQWLTFWNWRTIKLKVFPWIK